MSCQSHLPFRVAGICLCLGLAAAPALAAEVDAGEVYCFQMSDFSREESALSGICITELPVGGSLFLGERRVLPGDVLTGQQLDQLTFAPDEASEDDTAVVRYLPVFSSGLGPEAAVTISVWGKTDDPPVAEDAAIETYKNLPNEGLLRVSDPEGEELVYTVTRLPRRGTLIIRADGSYLYTPDKNKVGTDSFCFTATDPAGNVSREATVTVKILKPTDELQYTDTAGLACRFSAEWMRNTGIFSGASVSGQLCFSPDEAVSRGDFLAMLMETLELPVDHGVTETGFLDDAPLWLKPYLAAALRAGIISGSPVEGGTEFRPDTPIIGQDAAVIIRNALDFAMPTAVESDGTIAVWASETVSESTSSGLALPQGEQPLTRGDAAMLFYQLSRLLDTAPDLSVIFRK